MTTFYQIEIMKAYEPGSRQIERRFNNFRALHEELSELGIIDLPQLPMQKIPKILFS
jgi:hypothetical protein